MGRCNLHLRRSAYSFYSFHVSAFPFVHLHRLISHLTNSHPPSTPNGTIPSRHPATHCHGQKPSAFARTSSCIGACLHADFEERRCSRGPVPASSASVIFSSAVAPWRWTVDHGAAETGDLGVRERAEHFGVREKHVESTLEPGHSTPGFPSALPFLPTSLSSMQILAIFEQRAGKGTKRMKRIHD